jgi:hypothetical protein
VALCLHEQNLEGASFCCTNFNIGQIQLSPSGLANATPVTVMNGSASPLSLASSSTITQVIQDCDNISSSSKEEGELSTTSVNIKLPNPPEMSSIGSSESEFSPQKVNAKKQSSPSQLSLVSSKESSKNDTILEQNTRVSTSSSGSAEYNKFIAQQRLERDRKNKVWKNRRRSPSSSRSSSSSSTSSSHSSGSSSYATTSEYSPSSGSDTRASPKKVRSQKRSHSRSRSSRPSHSPFRKKARKSNRARNPSPPSPATSKSPRNCKK